MARSQSYAAIFPEDRDDAVIAQFDGARFKRTYLMKRGVACRADWPRKAVLTNGDASYLPAGPLLLDLVDNAMAWLIASARFRALLEEHCAPGDLEWLEVAIENEAGKKPRSGYAVANPLVTRPVIDHARSDVTMDTVITDQVHTIRKLVVRREVLAEQPALFRASDMNRYIFVRADLAAAITAAKLTGIVLIPSAKLATTSTGSPRMPGADE